MHTVEETVVALGGLASCDELRAHGHSLRDIDRPVRSGALLRVRRGWVMLPDAPADAVAAVRLGGILSCTTVLRRHGIWAGIDDGRLHVRVPRYAKLPAAAHGVTFHRSLQLVGLPPPRGGIEAASWALAQAVMCESRLDAVASLDSALHTDAVRPRPLESVMEQLPGRYRRYLELTDRRADSGIETRVRLGLRAVNIPFRIQVELAGIGRVDLLVGERLVIECDGREWHSDDQAVKKDYERDLGAAERGYLVLRLSYAQVMFEWPRVVAVVRAIVARGEHRWAARHRRGAVVTP